MVDKEIFSEWTPSPSCSSHQIVVYINIQELMCPQADLLGKPIRDW
jgi:hypothetical protein